MTTTAALRDPLLQPFRLKGLSLRNRIMSTSHAATIDEGGLPKERYQRYHEEKAKGGIALTMFGGSSMVARDSSWGGGQIDMSSDAIIPDLQAFSSRIHGQGAAIMCQISHLGRRATSAAMNWLPTVAPTAIRERRHRDIPREMDRHDIDRIIADYAAAAQRCKEGGLDGCETVTGGHLIGQFLSPRTNRRTDAFGGSLENRARFGLMVHEAIRRRVGDDYIVGIRFVIDEDIEEGIGFEECVRLARLFEREGHVDFFNAIFGRMDTDLSLAEHNMPGMSQPLAPFLAKVGAFRREVGLPVFHAARIPDIATARHAIAENLLDMVAMTRAHMADPQIVNKLMRGEEERIRPCVGASHCMYKKLACIHNPATGREQILPQIVPPSPQPGRKVVVVGGGPAGLEAARVAAERGHKVVLFEAANRLGGQLLLAVRATWRRDLIAIVDWRTAELARLGVEVRLNTYAVADDVLREKPDAVIVATGGVPATGWLDGAGALHHGLGHPLRRRCCQGRSHRLRRNRPPPGGVLRAAPRGAGPRRAVRHPRRQHGPGDGVQRPRRLPEALRRARRAHHHRPSARARPAVGQRPGRDLPARVDGRAGGDARAADRDRERHHADHRDLRCPQRRFDQRRDHRHRRPAGRRAAASDTAGRRRLRAAPHRRCRQQPQCPRRDLRCPATLHGPVG